jgi:hypothetical protein
MLADGRDVSGKTMTERWITQSPRSAKMFDLQYNWAGKCFPHWSVMTTSSTTDAEPHYTS